jgi:flagellar basal-body rod modification protein FlgD
MHIGAVTTNPVGAAGGNGLQSLSTEEFLRLLIAELSNQSPFDPIDNQALLEQISAVNAVQSTQTLINTLESLTLAQNLGSASALIGRTVVGIVDDQSISGTVDRAVVENGNVFLLVGSQRLPIDHVTEVR